MIYTENQITEIVKRVIKELQPDISGLSSNEKYKLASDPQTSTKTLEQLATDENFGVRYRVARHPNTPTKTLESLAIDNHSWVRYRVAKNPNTPTKTLEQLATDKNSDVRCGVAKNPNTPIKTLEQLATDEEFLRQFIVSKIDLPMIKIIKLSSIIENLY
jgi:hypothetical protein